MLESFQDHEMGRYAVGCAAGFLAAWMSAGCGEKPMEVYRLSKENEPAITRPTTTAPPTPEVPTKKSETPSPDSSERILHWDVPKGWRTHPGQGMRYATFVIPGKDGASAELSVVVLPGRAGGEFANINRWRDQIGLPPVDEKTLAKQSARVKSMAGTLLAVDYAGKWTGNGAKTRLLGAILSWNDKTWFFKLLGPEPTVTTAKPSFLKFLGSLR